MKLYVIKAFCPLSNILAVKTFTLGGITLPTAVIVFPLVYIINDVLAEIYGYEKAKRVIYLGFIVNAFAVLAYTIAIHLPAPDYMSEVAASFEMVLGNTFRMLLASFSAYIIGSLVNAKIMVKLKEKYEHHLMARCMTSTFFGEGIDALIFITIAFIGTMPATTLLTMIIAQALFKTAFEFICYPVTKKVINKIKLLEG
jgi:uncharacterized integral membrane protein (TIGR00697 family)